MIHIRDFLNKVMWDKSLRAKGLCIDDYYIFYHDRVDNCLKQIRLSYVKKIMKNFMELADGTEIPLHRIREVRLGRKLVWERKT